jgi:hypothetical protein
VLDIWDTTAFLPFDFPLSDQLVAVIFLSIVPDFSTCRIPFLPKTIPELHIPPFYLSYDDWLMGDDYQVSVLATLSLRVF